MTIEHFIRQTTSLLAAAGIESPRLDTLILLEDAIGVDRSQLLAHPDQELTSEQLVNLDGQCRQRVQHIPLAYIRGHAAFYGRDFLVTPDVLVPRPETEDIITLILELPADKLLSIVDVGAGSGCIGITLALELPQAVVVLADISPKALAVAKRNAQLLHATIRIVQSDLLDNTLPADVLTANLPYVPTAYPINRAATKEPPVALFSGSDGLDHYRRFWQQLQAADHRPHYVLTEAFIVQHPQVASLALAAGFRLVKTKGLIQLFSS